MLRIVPTDKELYGAAQRAALLPYLTDAVIHHFHLDLDNICFLYLHLCLHHCLIFHLSSHSQKFQLLDSQPSCVPSGKVVVTELSQICTTGLLVIDNNTNKIQQISDILGFRWQQYATFKYFGQTGILPETAD